MAISKFDTSYKSALLDILVDYDVYSLKKYSIRKQCPLTECALRVEGECGIYHEYTSYVTKLIKKIDFGMDSDSVHHIILKVFGAFDEDMLDEVYVKYMALDISNLFSVKDE